MVSRIVKIAAGMTLPYPDAAVGWEVTFLVLLLVLEQSRLFLGETADARLVETVNFHVPVVPGRVMIWKMR